MKVRNGFVSNSSSSSFTCDICKDTAVDYNGECEIDYVICEEGHEICRKHLKGGGKLSTEKMREALLKDVDSWDSGADERESERDSIRGFDAEEVEDSYNDLVDSAELSKEQCPLCSFKTLTDESVLEYLLMLVGSTKKSIIEQALENYESYKEFENQIKNHKKEMKQQGKK